ncbi:hypothetical protein BESB_068390 [Besnoitia besnoiti]|uniref:Integral membrane bound transporter domain-containing protein n=1 Tax=Besnoitia besnoiti TaxID=94643 RepID=A0A2A9MFQ6_BESBE|nr:hypothetical protein BESB_068390 [Besnoitia besnoiti]PFH34806.1 hypothetical protein BESB_068390 [Besnoitia besnoiti]
MKLPGFLRAYRGAYSLPEGEDADWNTYTIFPAQSSVAANVVRRFERGIRLALGGALVYVLSMIDIPSLDYSFRYVAPFVYWVVAALTPPFWSTIPLLVFAGLFCIVCVCGCVSALLSLMTLGDPQGKIASVIMYGVFMAWALGLNVGKKKEMTIIGSYILMYVMPLASLIALPYAVGGVSIPISPEMIDQMKGVLESASPKVMQLLVHALAAYFGEDPAVLQAFVTKFFSDPRFVNLIILKINTQTHAGLPLFPWTQKLDPVVVMQTLIKALFTLFPGDKVLDFHFKIENLDKLDTDFGWLQGAPCSVYGTLNSGILVSVETGLWLVKVLWTAEGRLGFLRNLLAFACLGYSIWVLVMITPPIHRQRDVVRRDMADCTININRCLRATREVLHCLEGTRGMDKTGRGRESGSSLPGSPCDRDARTSLRGGARGSNNNARGGGMHKQGSRPMDQDLEAGRMYIPSSPARRGQSSSSYIKALSFSSAKFVEAAVPLKQSIIKLHEDQKRVLMSGMEPYLISAGPMVFVVREVNEVRERLLQCSAYVQQLCRVLFDVVRSSVVNSEFSIWTPTMYKIEAIIAKAEEVYQTCGELIMMQPARVFRKKHHATVDGKLAHLKRLELELAALHKEINELANEATDKVFHEFGDPYSATDEESSSRAPSPRADPLVDDRTPSPLNAAGPVETRDTEAGSPGARLSQPEGQFGAVPPAASGTCLGASKEGSQVSGRQSQLFSQSNSADTAWKQQGEGEATGAVVDSEGGLVEMASLKKNESLAEEEGADPTRAAKARRSPSHMHLRYEAKAQHPLASLDQKEARNVSKTMDHMPLSMALVAKFHATYKEPVALVKAVEALHVAQRRRSWKNLMMNLAFPLLPMLVHAGRLTVTPFQQLLFWRKKWRGPDAWWRDPEFWYLVKYFVPLMLLFSFAVFYKDFSQYTWGQQLATDPNILDFCTQGITTRAVPWIMLGFLTCLQPTYNGTVFRGLNRMIGILFGSGTAWIVMYVCGHSVAKIVCFSSCLLFLDIFLTTDWKNPNYGFHSVWGYAGMVFTYTHALIIGLAFESLGGLTGSRDYLTVTRIVSNLLGILLALVVAHIPPVCSGNNAASELYGDSLKCCALAVDKAVQYLLEASDHANSATKGRSSSHLLPCGSSRVAGSQQAGAVAPSDSRSSAYFGTKAHAAAAGAVTVAAAAQNTVPLINADAADERSALASSGGANSAGSRPKGASTCDTGKRLDSVQTRVGDESDTGGAAATDDKDVPEDSLQEALRILRGPAAEYLDAGQRFYKEGCNQLWYFPWRTNPVLDEVYLAVGSMRKRNENMCDLLKAFMTEGYSVDERVSAFADEASAEANEEDKSPHQFSPLLVNTAATPTEQRPGNLQAVDEVVNETEVEDTKKKESGSPPAIPVRSIANPEKAPRFGHKRKGSLYVLKEGNAAAITELFKTKSGAQLRRELATAVQALKELTDAVVMELKIVVPTTVDRFMARLSGAKTDTQIEPDLPDVVHERCRDQVETAFSYLTLTLANCLVEHRMQFEDSVARRRAAAFTVMATIYYLDIQKRSLDTIHESLVARRGNSPQEGWCSWCCRPGMETLGID